MKYIPILFSTPMIQAKMDGRKNQTRRIADVPVGEYNGQCIMDWPLSEYPTLKDGKWVYRVQTDVDDYREVELKPKYRVGDIIWVRETWQESTWLHASDENYGYIYKASDSGRDWEQNSENWKWRPSIFMPKSACRIFLEITNVRVERLQDISEEDAIAEGIINFDFGVQSKKGAISFDGGDTYHSLKPERVTLYSCKSNPTQNQCFKSAKAAFINLWQSINGSESWDENPFVWVIDFTPIDKPENFI